MMKAGIPALVAVFAFAMACLADDKPRTIVTRDHQTYEKATIVDRGDVSVTIAYDAGVVRVSLENLPADIQKELGYVSKNPEPVEVKSTPPPPTPAVVRAKITPEAPPALADAFSTPPVNHTPAPKNPVPIPAVAPARPFTQAEANAFYGLKESTILKKWGKPVKIEQFTDLSKRQVKVLIYDEDQSISTKFWIYEKDGFVSGGVCKGRPIRSAAQQAKLDTAKAAGDQ